QTLIASTCKKLAKEDPNIHYAFCTTSLQSAPASPCAADLRALGSISIRLLRDNVTNTRCYIRGSLKNKKLGGDSYTRECWTTCLDLYSDAVDAARLAAQNYNTKAYDEANVELSAALTDASTCEDGFGEKPGVVSPLTKRNGDAVQLSAMALSIIYFIHTNNNN
ncbi:hypothetical protein M569_02589, partial [Genlisea aurea]